MYCIVHCLFILVNTLTNVNKWHLIVKCYQKIPSYLIDCIFPIFLIYFLNDRCHPDIAGTCMNCILMNIQTKTKQGTIDLYNL